MSNKKFNSNLDSPLFEREEFQELASVLKKRTPVYLCVDENSYGGNNPNALSPLDDFLKKNVQAWVYVYCTWRSGVTSNVQLLISGNEQTGMGTYNILPETINTTLACFCYPIYGQNTNGLRIDNALSTTSNGNEWSGHRFWSRVRAADGGSGSDWLTTEYPRSSDIIAFKISKRPPFNTSEFNQISAPALNTNLGLSVPNYTLSENRLRLFFGLSDNAGNVNPSGGNILTTSSNSIHTIYLQRLTTPTPHLSEPYTLSKSLSFTPEDIIANGNDPAYNPKLLGSDCFQIRLESADGQSFEYDAQKLGLQTFRMAYTEALTPDVTRGYLRILTQEGNVYHSDTANNFTGLVYSTDNSMIFSSTAWSEFIANNKNFFQMAQMQKDFSNYKLQEGNRTGIRGLLLGDIMNNTAEASMGNPSRVVEGIFPFGIGKGIHRTRLGMEKNALQYQKQMLAADNVKAAPNNVQNASGNAYFLNFITQQQMFICEYEALPHELAMANENMHMNGFSYGRIGNVQDFLNTRKTFNFIQAEVQTISGVPMSNEIREDIKRRFAEGIRFWNVDAVDYDAPNHEKRLE